MDDDQPDSHWTSRVRVEVRVRSQVGHQVSSRRSRSPSPARLAANARTKTAMAGASGDPRDAEQVLAAPGGHRAELGRGRRRAEADERQPGEDEDEATDVELAVTITAGIAPGSRWRNAEPRAGRRRPAGRRRRAGGRRRRGPRRGRSARTRATRRWPPRSACGGGSGPSATDDRDRDHRRRAARGTGR